MRIRTTVERYALPVYLVLAFGISWLAALPLLVMPREQWPAVPVLAPLVWIMKFGPSLAGIILTGICSGAPGVADLFARMVPDRAQVRCVIVALCAALALLLATVGIRALTHDSFPAIHLAAVTGIVPLFLQKFFLGGGLGEEFGWRGFALPRLQARLHPMTASLLVGLVWGLWHLPAFFIDGAKQGESLTQFLLAVVALSILFSWFYNRSGGSLLVVVTLHAMLNASERTFEEVFPGLLDEDASGWILLLVLVGAAVLVAAASRLRLGFVARHPEDGATSS